MMIVVKLAEINFKEDLNWNDFSFFFLNRFGAVAGNERQFKTERAPNLKKGKNLFLIKMSI